MLGTEKYKSRKYDLFAARKKILLLLLITIIAISVTAGDIYLIFFGGNFWAKAVGIVLGLILLMFWWPFSIHAPYWISDHIESGKRLVRPEPAQRSLPVNEYTEAAPKIPGIRVLGEGIHVRTMKSGTLDEETTWEIKTFFSVFNDTSHPIILYDMHARSYCRWYELFPDTSLMIKGRQEVTLSSENSILHEGKVFEIDPKDNMSFSLSLEVSRYPGDEWTMVVFGIFTDFHDNEGTGSICFPVDCVFCFLNLPAHSNTTNSNRIEAFHANSNNIGQLWEKYYTDSGWRRVMKVIDTSLEIQLTSLRRHV